MSEKHGRGVSFLYYNIVLIPGNNEHHDFHYRLKDFTIHGEPDNVEIYVDGRPTYHYNEDSINVSLPESYRNTKFSNISIAVPINDVEKRSVLTLCEVLINLGKCITCRTKWTDDLVGLDFNGQLKTHSRLLKSCRAGHFM